MSSAFERRVKRLREHVLSHNKQDKQEIVFDNPLDFTYKSIASDGEGKVINLSDLKVEDLKELAKEKGIEGYSKMKKEELIDLLTEGE